MLAELQKDFEGYWVAGMIFADGTGSPTDFGSWVEALSARLSDPFDELSILFDPGDYCAGAWALCKQIDRRTSIAKYLSRARGGLHWLEGAWHANWCDAANLDVEPAPAVAALEARLDHAAAVARSRALFGRGASWPDAGEFALLRLWPSVRVGIGVRLQTAISVGAQRSDVLAMLPMMVAQATRSLSAEG